jgi:hypothetical protein
LAAPSIASDPDLGTRTQASYGPLQGGDTSVVAVTVNTGTSAMVILTGLLDAQAGGQAYMSFGVTGQTALAASNARALILRNGATAAGGMQASATLVLTGLNAGANTFTLQYKSSGFSDTASFSNRTITVIPLN